MQPSGPKTYELMYDSGGHGGPWYGLSAAVEGAKQVLRGRPTERAVYVVPRDERFLEKRNAVRIIRREDVDKS